MTPPAPPERDKHHRFPAKIIRHGVWLYDRFCLSYCDVEELLFVRGVIVSFAGMAQSLVHLPYGVCVGRASRRRPRSTRAHRPGDRRMLLRAWRAAAACAASHRWRVGRRPTPERGARAGKVSCPDPAPEAEIAAPWAPETGSQVCRRHAGRLCTGDVRAPWRIHTRRGSGADCGG